MIEARIKQVMSDVFGIPLDQVSPHSSTENVELWDSLHHMSLLLALEQEFEVTFDDADLSELTTLGAIQAAVTRLKASA